MTTFFLARLATLKAEPVGNLILVILAALRAGSEVFLIGLHPMLDSHLTLPVRNIPWISQVIKNSIPRTWWNSRTPLFGWLVIAPSMHLWHPPRASSHISSTLDILISKRFIHMTTLIKSTKVHRLSNSDLFFCSFIYYSGISISPHPFLHFSCIFFN